MINYNRLGRRKVRQAASVLLAVLLIGVVTSVGLHLYGSSRASTANATMSLSPSSGSFSVGSEVAVSVTMDSGADPVNAVQASLTYNPNHLQYVSITESGAFPLAAATNTEPGIIRVARGIQNGEVKGSQKIVTVNFKVIAATSATSLNLDPAYSFIVKSTDSKNVLGSVTGSNFNIGGGGSGRPAFTLSPVSGNYAPGSSVAVAVRIRSGTLPITTVQPIVQYPADKLEFVNVTEGGVFPTIQRTKNSGGTIDIIRGVSGGSKGLTGDQLIVTLNFKVIGSSGAAALTLGNASAAFDNSGSGRNILHLASSTGANYVLSANSPQIHQNRQVVIIAKPGGSTVTSNGVKQAGGTVEILPVVSETVLQQTPGDTIAKVEYLIGKKVIATKTTSPFTHNFDTRDFKNGAYEITVRTHYKSGAVDDSKDQLLVSNPVNASYVAKHYLVPVIIGVVGVVSLLLVAIRYLLPRFRRGGGGPAASGPLLPGSGDTAGQSPAGAATPINGPVAADPTVIAPGTQSLISSSGPAVDSRPAEAQAPVASPTDPAVSPAPASSTADPGTPAASPTPASAPSPAPSTGASAAAPAPAAVPADPVSPAASPAPAAPAAQNPAPVQNPAVVQPAPSSVISPTNRQF